MDTLVSQDLHVALVPEVTVEFSVFTDRRAQGEPPLSPPLLSDPYSAMDDDADDNDDNQPRSMYFEEEFAYPTNLTSGPSVPDEDDDYYYEDDHTGSDLIQVTVEDLLISKEQSRTIKASMDLARQESSRPSIVPAITTTGTRTTPSSSIQSKTVNAPGSSTPSSPNPAITTTTITATIRTVGGRGTSFLFDGDTEDASSSNATVAQLLASKQAHSQFVSPPPSSSSEQSLRSQLPSSANSSATALPGQTTAAGTAQGQQEIVSKMRGVSQLPTSRKPAVPLTPAQQREAEADDNIQRAIELHERNQLAEATHYFHLAAQSENPLGQLMYGLSLRHGWGCKADPKEAIVYLQRAAEYAMGEMRVIDGGGVVTSSAPVSTTPTHLNTTATDSNILRSPPLSSPSSPSSISTSPPSRTTAHPTQPAATASPPMQSVRRMGSMDRTAAMSMARRELVMALYELGMSYLKGWGVTKDKPVAFTYFKIAADLGDPDSQNETALCYYEGIGIEKDMYESAKYYRMASAQGASQLGNSWIWKPKYDQYCAAENAAVSAAATIGSVSVVTNATAKGTKKGSSKERAKKLTSAIQTAIATSATPSHPPLSASSGAGNRNNTASSTPSSPSSVRSRTKSPGSWITQNNNASSTTLNSSSSSPTSSSAPSIPSPQYTLSSIASGLASVTAATSGSVVPPVYGTSTSRNGSTTNINSNVSSSPTSPTSPRPSITSVAAPGAASTAPTTPTSQYSSETVEKKKRRWTLFSGQRTPPHSSS
ncbi:hypothetical protein BGX24_000178 [Mortierella sp. AD032]|nr:hypothetical protein BGX24_000178 [Mortierella sp. AD032]